MVRRFTARPQYPAHRLKEHAQNYKLLIDTYHAEPVSFPTADGLQLSGLLIVRPHAKRAIILSHGYRMCKERTAPFAHIFPDDTLLLFDHRAHGQSEGLLTSFGYHEKDDVLAAVDFLQHNPQTKGLPLYGVGISMGAVSLLKAAAERNVFNAIILDSPFAQLDRQARSIAVRRYKFLPEKPFRFIARAIFAYLMQFSMHDVDAIAVAHTLKTPVLLIHSQYDDTASPEDARELFDAIASPKMLWVVDASGHARIFKDCLEQYAERVRAFFDQM